MTRSGQVEEHFEGLSCDNTQQRQKPFQVVLIDIKMAAKNYVIHCVEKPLEGDLKFVALSYRWGELHETTVDTKLNYLASVTSFALEDFYNVCVMMTYEVDLKDMDYVWVDAICVDQNNHERRKRTIYQMNNIYKHANFILAVPDLHLRYLWQAAKMNAEIFINTVIYNCEYIYHLIHGNTDVLASMDEKFLDKIGVPTNPALRKLLTTYSGHFADDFMEYREYRYYHTPEEILDHIYANSETSKLSKHSPICGDIIHSTRRKKDQAQTPRHRSPEIDCLHYCNNIDCPLEILDSTSEPPEWRSIYHFEGKDNDKNLSWKQRISKRSSNVRHSMNLMTDLIRDWSSRVWVISEYNIAKNKNNLKYWFTLLGQHSCSYGKPFPEAEDFAFFKFDFGDPSHAARQKIDIRISGYTLPLEPVHQTFHQTMIGQLKKQTFLEMMLKSKASKHEDRFSSIFPLCPEYKEKLKSKALEDIWKINTLLSVKLKLFELLSTKDKLNLLFLLGNFSAENRGIVLPTFATSNINWVCTPTDFLTLKDVNYPCNFDLEDDGKSVITLVKFNNSFDDDAPMFYLDLKPKEFYVTDSKFNEAFTNSEQALWYNKTLCERLELNKGDDTIHLVCIPSFGKEAMNKHATDMSWYHYSVVLIGSFDKNKWVVNEPAPGDDVLTLPNWIHCCFDDGMDRFHIY